jgi:hypothetical protein
MRWITLALITVLGVLILALIRPEGHFIPIGLALTLLFIHDVVWLFIDKNDRMHKQ